jgi:hypothetical protein
MPRPWWLDAIQRAERPWFLLVAWVIAVGAMWGGLTLGSHIANSAVSTIATGLFIVIPVVAVVLTLLWLNSPFRARHDRH